MRSAAGWSGDPAELQDELDQLAVALGHSVSLDGPDGALLAYSAQGADADPVRIDAILTRQVPEAVLAYQRDHLIDTATAPVRVPANPALDMAARTCLPIRDGRRLLAHLWVLDQGEAMDATARQHLDDSGARLRRLVPSSHTSDVDAVVAQLLTDLPKADLLDRLLHRGRLHPGQILQFVAVVPTSTTGRERGPVPSGEQPRPRAAALGRAGRDGQLLLLHSPADADGGSADRAARLFAGPAGTHQVVGCSSAFPAGTTDVSMLAARALVAAGCSAVDGALPAAVDWAGLGPYRHLLTARSAAPPDQPPIPADDRSGPAMRHTLETFLDHGGDAARTIAALGVHRTTYYYRLDRLAGHYGLRLDDGFARTEYHLALKADRLARARDHFGWTDRFLARLG